MPSDPKKGHKATLQPKRSPTPPPPPPPAQPLKES